MVFLAELRKCAETHTIWGTEYGSLDLGDTQPQIALFLQTIWAPAPLPAEAMWPRGARSKVQAFSGLSKAISDTVQAAQSHASPHSRSHGQLLRAHSSLFVN